MTERAKRAADKIDAGYVALLDRSYVVRQPWMVKIIAAEYVTLEEEVVGLRDNLDTAEAEVSRLRKEVDVLKRAHEVRILELLRFEAENVTLRLNASEMLDEIEYLGSQAG